jgi:hypothetical protein
VDTAIFTFPTDFAGETVATVLSHIRDEADVRGVTLAANYHAARDIFSHNPKFKVHVSHGGSLFFDAKTARATTIGVTCRPDAIANDEFGFQELVEQVRAAGLNAYGWLNLCHLDNFAAPPETLCQNAFGDLDYSTVCPANSDVVKFAAALTYDVARCRPDQIVTEAIQFSPVVHGYHHERWPIELSELTRYLLGLCFCSSCRAGLAAEGAEVSHLIGRVRDCVERALGEGSAERQEGLTADEVEMAIGEDAQALWAHRSRAVLALAEEVNSAARAGGSSAQFVDPSGAMKGYSTGQSSGAAGPMPGWLLGAAPELVAQHCEHTAVLLYTDSVARAEEELGAWSARGVDLSRITAVLRPSLPDCRSQAELVSKVRMCRDAGVGGVSFYHYGLFPLTCLAWIRSALNP